MQNQKSSKEFTSQYDWSNPDQESRSSCSQSLLCRMWLSWSLSGTSPFRNKRIFEVFHQVGVAEAFPDIGGVQGWWKQCWRSGCCCHAHWPTNAIRNGTGGCPWGIILIFVIMLYVQFEEMMAEASMHRLGAFSPYFHLGRAIEVILRILGTARSSLYSIIQNRPLCTRSYPLTLTLPSLAASMCLSPTFPVDPSPTPLSLNFPRGREVQ